MKVSELIAELQKQPQDAVVVVSDTEYWLIYNIVKGTKLTKVVLTFDQPKKLQRPDEESSEAVELTID